jgi:hypothetical protein
VNSYDYWLHLLYVPMIGLVVGIGGAWLISWGLSMLRVYTR